MKSVAVILTLAVSVLIAINAILIDDQPPRRKCFVCNSFHQADCADWFDNVTQHLTECPDGFLLCRKVIQEAYYDGKWDVRYIRSCAQDGEVGSYEGRICQERVGTWRVKMLYCHCDNQDGCNTASLKFSTTTGMLVIIGTVSAWLLYNLS